MSCMTVLVCRNFPSIISLANVQKFLWLSRPSSGVQGLICFIIFILHLSLRICHLRDANTELCSVIFPMEISLAVAIGICMIFAFVPPDVKELNLKKLHII